MNFLLMFIQPFIYAWAGLLLSIIVLPMAIIVLPLSSLTRFKLTAPFWYFYFNMVMKVVIFAKVYTDDRRDSQSQNMLTPPGLYIANHQSFIDIPLAYSHFLIPPIMKKSLLYVPVLGICAYSSSGIMVNRHDPESRRKVFQEAAKRLTSGLRHLIYYPEGTRNKKSSSPKNVEQIKTALIKFAYQNQINVFPISMFGTNRIIRNKLIHPRQPVGIILHSSVSPKDFESETEFVNACWSKVCEGHQELSEKLS